MRRKLVVVLPYYGRLPDYLPLYLESLSHMEFDVMCFTDLRVPDAPENFIVRPMSLGQLRSLAVRKIGLPVNLSAPRKLCDLKPMYGKIFEDYIGDYEYWAFGDCDLVYGRSLNGTLARLLDGSRDVISLRKDWISGGLCILRNAAAVNVLFRDASNLDEILASGECECFDELGDNWFGAVRGGRMTVGDCGRRKDCFSAIVWRRADLSFFHEDVLSEDRLLEGDVISASDGHLRRNGREIDAFHFIESKKCYWFSEWFPRLRGVSLRDYRITNCGVFRTDFQWRHRREIGLARKAVAKCKSLFPRAGRFFMRRILKAIS